MAYRGKPIELASALALFPSLTHLNLKYANAFYALPTALRSLSLYHEYLDVSLAEEETGGTTYLAQHFPNLTALKLVSPCLPNRPLQPICRFISAHSTQLTSLAVNYLSGIFKEHISALPWPKLRAAMRCSRTHGVEPYAGTRVSVSLG